ncbi:HupE/UreJ family protein [Thiogranum longum]
MTRSITATVTTLIAGLAATPAALAHPGHQHEAALFERLIHALMTEWHFLVILAVALPLGACYLRKAKRG